MSITTRAVEHHVDGEIFESLFVFNDAKPGKRPTILVFHAWEGRSEDQEKFARRLTEWGYNALAVDLFGKGKRGRTTEECQALMQPLASNRALLRQRLLKIPDVAQGQPEVDAAKIAAIGFCFGGLCALDLARAGGKIKGVASFHGILAAPGLPVANPFCAKVIAFHGWDDPMAPPDQVLAFAKELTGAGADWQFHAFGGTHHAFMNEAANNPQMGLVYNAKATGQSLEVVAIVLGRRAWRLTYSKNMQQHVDNSGEEARAQNHADRQSKQPSQ
jgi:dienelactone hydrolase